MVIFIFTQGITILAVSSKTNAMNKLFFVDTETVNTDRSKCGIFQLAAVVIEESTGFLAVKDKVDFRMCPQESEYWDELVLDHIHYSFKDIEKFRPQHLVFREFVKFLDSHIDRYNKEDKFFFVAYNAAFDYQKIRNWFDANNDSFFGSYFWSNPMCLMSLSTYALKDQRHLMPNFKLQTVCLSLGIELPKAHDAMSDIIALVGLYETLTDSL